MCIVARIYRIYSRIYVVYAPSLHVAMHTAYECERVLALNDWQILRTHLKFIDLLFGIQLTRSKY